MKDTKNKKERSRLYSKDFILFFMVIAQASFGSSVSVIALAFLVLKITGSASAMSLTLGLRILPSIFMPFMSTFLDRVHVKSPLIASFVIRGILLVGLYIGIQEGLFAIYAIYVVALINGVLATVAMPSCQIIIPGLLKNSDLERGNSLINIAEQSVSLIGLLFGGIMVSLLGPIISVLIEGICYIIAGLVVLFIFIEKTAKKIENGFLCDVAIGFSMLGSFRVIALTTLMCFFINVFFAAIEVFLPLHMIYIAKGAAGYGFFMSFMMVGMLLGSSAIAFMGTKFKCALGITIGWLGLSLAFMGLGARNSFYYCLLWGCFLGVGVSIINTCIRVILQKTINHNYRGRVNGISVALSSIGMPAAFIVLSYVVKSLAFDGVFLLGSMFAMVFSVVWFFYIKNKPAIFFEEEYAFKK